MWKPGWNYIGDEATVTELKRISERDAWIIEGYIEKEAMDSVLGRAETIIYLDYSPHVAAWRYLKRWWRHRTIPRPELEGSPETFKFEFLQRVWNKREADHLDKFLAQMPRQDKIVTFTSPKAAASFLETL
jgi:adenylate kinase family enzyme